MPISLWLNVLLPLNQQLQTRTHQRCNMISFFFCIVLMAKDARKLKNINVIFNRLNFILSEFSKSASIWLQSQQNNFINHCNCLIIWDVTFFCRNKNTFQLLSALAVTNKAQTQWLTCDVTCFLLLFLLCTLKWCL